jgi:hypothetical protein
MKVIFISMFIFLCSLSVTNQCKAIDNNIPDKKVIEKLKDILLALDSQEAELVKKSEKISLMQKQKKETRVEWGKFSHQWNVKLKKVRDNKILVNDGLLNLKTVEDKAKNSIESYGSQLFLFWQMLNEKELGKKHTPDEWKYVEAGLTESKSDSKKAVDLLLSGQNNLGKWDK